MERIFVDVTTVEADHVDSGAVHCKCIDFDFTAPCDM